MVMRNPNIVFLLLVYISWWKIKTQSAEVYPHLSLSLSLSPPFLFFTLWTVDRGIGPSQPETQWNLGKVGSIYTLLFSIHTLFHSQLFLLETPFEIKKQFFRLICLVKTASCKIYSNTLFFYFFQNAFVLFWFVFYKLLLKIIKNIWSL